MKTYTILFLLFFSLEISAQTNPFTSQQPLHNNVIVDLRSTDKAFQLPNQTRADRNQISSPNSGMLIFEYDTPSSSSTGLFVYQNRTNNKAGWYNLINDNMGDHIFRQDASVTNKILMGDHEVYFNNGNLTIEVKDPANSNNNVRYTMENDGILYIRDTQVRNPVSNVFWNSVISTQKHYSREPIYMNNFNISEDASNNHRIHLGSNGPEIVNSSRRLVMQADGNLVFYDANNSFIWASTPDSDRRMKHILSPMENILDRVMEMDLVEFKYKKEESFHVIQPKKLHFGVIAQNILQLFPRYNQDLVTGGSLTSSDRLYVDYRYYNVLAIKAIQEFKTQHDEQIKELRTQVSQKNQTTEFNELEEKLHLLTQKANKIEKKLYLLDKKPIPNKK